VLELEGKIC